MKSTASFAETPPPEICKKVVDLINAIQHPSPPAHPVNFSDPGRHFQIGGIFNLPREIQTILTTTNPITTGYISSIRSFWVASPKSLHLLILQHRNSVFELDSPAAEISLPVIAVGFISGRILATHTSSISLFSFPELQPIDCTFSIPKSVTITVIESDIAGCSDGTVRKLFVNAKTHLISISSSKSSRDDPIIKIASNPNFYVALSKSNVLSIWGFTFFSKNEFSCRHSIQLAHIVAIWSSSNCVFTLDKSATLREFSFDGNKLSPVQAVCVFRRLGLVSAIWAVGMLAAVEGGRWGADKLTVARFHPSPITVSEQTDQVFCLADSGRFISVLTGKFIRQISERLDPITADEEAWCFANIISRVWDSPPSVLIETNDFIRTLERWPTLASYPIMAILAKYVLTIVDDFTMLSSPTHLRNEPLSQYFKESRLTLFPRLRKLALASRMRNQTLECADDEISILIERADAGSELDAQRAMTLICSSDVLPVNFNAYVSFLSRHSFHHELIDCVLRWTNSVQEDLYFLLEPTLKNALTPETSAREAVKTALIQSQNPSFQKFVVEYLDRHSTWQTTIQFDFPGMLDLLHDMQSTQYQRVLMVKGDPISRFQAYLDFATSGSVISVDDRIEYAQKAHCLFPADSEPQRLLKIANVIRPIADTHPEFFKMDSNEIINVLLAEQNFRMALDICRELGLRRADVLELFLEFAPPQEIQHYIASKGIFSEVDIANALFGTEDGISRLATVGITPRVIFDLARHLDKEKQLEFARQLTDLLRTWEPVDLDLREEAADLYCDLIVRLEVEENMELAEEIRGMLGKCFLDRKFQDVWDLI